MHVTSMIEAITQLSKQYDEPPSYLTIARDSILKQLALKNQVEMPPILDDAQRKVFMDNLKFLKGFLESDDGADAIELLVNAFEHYCYKMENAPDAVEE